MNPKLHPLLWKELKRQKKSKITPIIQVIAYCYFYIYLKSIFSIEIVLSLIPLMYVLSIQTDVFHYDFTNYIESLLSLPIEIINIIKSKCIFILLKAYIQSIITILILLIYHVIIEKKDMVFSVKTFLLIIVLPIWQYYFSYFIGLVIWNLKSKIRIIPYLFQIIILLTCILLLSKNMVNILILIMLGLLLPISIGIKKLTETLSKERILKRSI